MIRYGYPPEVDEDKNFQVRRIEGVSGKPPLPPGYLRDPNDSFHLLNDWVDCKHREFYMYKRACGAPGIVPRCLCRECPLFSKRLEPDDCTFCEYLE